MIGQLGFRAGQAAATLFIAVTLIFVAVRVVPGDPLQARFGQHSAPAEAARIRRERGLDQPTYVQLGAFYWQLLISGDFGQSLAREHENVRQELGARLPATIELTLAATLIAIPLGIVAGVAAAVWRNRLPDFACMAAALLGVSIPVFFLGLCLKELLPAMPSGGRLPSWHDLDPLTGFYLIDAPLRGRFDLWGEAFRHLCLPAAALSTIPTAIIARITRSSMLESISADFTRTAAAKGAGPGRIVWGHAFPNAAAPVANIAGFQIGMLLSGAVLTESVFNWPGLGSYVVEAVLNNDYPIVQAGAAWIAAVFVASNLLLDLLYLWLDPRLRDQ